MAVVEDLLPKAHHHEHDHGVPMEYRDHDGAMKIFGFWVFLAADLILFACVFATYVVMNGNTDGGPTPKGLYEVPTFLAETLILLTSSFTCGVGIHEMRRGHKNSLVVWLIITALLGLSFIGLEVNEFVKYATHGAPISRSGFLSAFFVLVGTHGCHVSLGIVWMTCIIIQLARRGITPVTARKAFTVGLYWHFLDVVWVFIFTVVYMAGVIM